MAGGALGAVAASVSAGAHFSVDAANPGEGETCVVRCQPRVQLSSVLLEVYWGSAGFACLSIPFPLLGASFPQCRIIPHHLNTLTTPLQAAPIPISAGLRGSFPCSPLLHPTSTPARHPGIIAGLRNGGGDAPGAASFCCTGKRHLGKGLRNSQPPGALAQAVNLQPGLVVSEPRQNTLPKPGAQNEEIPVPSSLLVSSAPSVPHGPLAGQCPVSRGMREIPHAHLNPLLRRAEISRRQEAPRMRPAELKALHATPSSHGLYLPSQFFPIFLQGQLNTFGS